MLLTPVRNGWTEKFGCKPNRAHGVVLWVLVEQVARAGGHLGSSSYKSIDIWQPSTGLSNVSSLNLSLRAYPNPTSETLAIEWQKSDDENISLVVTDNLGRVIQQEKLTVHQSHLTLNCKAWQQGIYTITLSDGKAAQSCRIFKN